MEALFRRVLNNAVNDGSSRGGYELAIEPRDYQGILDGRVLGLDPNHLLLVGITRVHPSMDLLSWVTAVV